MIKICDKLWRKLVFWVGDIRRISHFPFVTWDVHQHAIDYSEALEGLKHVRAGDIGLHRDIGYLSNIALPGFMKHGWIHVDDYSQYGIENVNIVEAISEGVVKRHALWPLRSDFSIILRPIGIPVADRLIAVDRANSFVGCAYDANFKFDIEDELEHFSAKDHSDYHALTDNLCNGWEGGFACTEVCAAAYWDVRYELGLARKKVRGKDAIIADDFFNNDFEIVWASKACTPENARKLGLHEFGVMMLEDYWNNVES